MSISYTLGIPDRNHNPSVDQPNMQINNDAVNQIIGIDHISFNAQGADVSGTHKQISFNGSIVPTAPTGLKSNLYTNTVSPTVFAGQNQLLWQTPSVTLPISPIRAFFSFVASNSPSFTNQYNCLSITHTVGNNFVIAIKTGVISNSSRPVVLTDPNQVPTFGTDSITVTGNIITSQIVNVLIIQV